MAPGDAAALADAVRGLLDDPQAALELAARGVRQSLTWPDEDAALAAVAAVYTALLGRRV